MNIHQDRKAADGDKQLPGCLGLMMNLFDVSAGVARNRLLTDRPHRDGSPITRSLSDVAVTGGPFDKDQTMSSSRSSSNRKPKITPIKLLIAQEMSREFDFKQGGPNLVAKLMGLDPLPIQLPKSIARKGQSRSCLQQSRSLSHSRRRTECSHHGRSFSDDQILHRFQECQEYKWQQFPNGSSKKEKSSAKARSSDIIDEKKMALVREKFMEAKRLAPDEKLRQSKEFQDAVEVLSSNRDLFLKILQEPKSLFSRHMHEYHSIPSPPETKRITILRPSKMVDNHKLSAPGKKKSECLTKKPSQDAEGTGWDRSVSGYSSTCACQEVDDYPTQPTRIVLLKPGRGKSDDTKPVVPPPFSSPGMLHGDNFDEDNEVEETRDVEKEHESLTAYRRVSSVFSNGYIGDGSSFNRSEKDYYLEGNLSDSEVGSPTSRDSWDFVKRIGSPHSTPSFSHASFSSESLVCKEATKRLFERWALTASSRNSPQQSHAQKSSSTLGEMLALSDSKKSVTIKENGHTCKDQEWRRSSSSLTYGVIKEEAHAHSPKNLSRSKSVPAVYDNRLNVQVSEPDGIGELEKKAAGKSSLKWRVSSLFFSRSRNSSRDKIRQSDHESQSTAAETTHSSECPYEKMGSSVPNVAAGNLNENHEQPSPISPLDLSFEEDEKISSEGSGKQMSSQMLKSNLIDKSPPIGSLTRTLPWHNSYTENTSPCPLKTQTASLCHEEEDEQDWLVFIRTILSASSLEGKDPSDSSVLDWYSPASPPDPSLMDKFKAVDDNVALPEAKRRRRRSNRKLAFDYTSALVVEMVRRGAREGHISAEQVWARMKGWFTEAAVDGGSGESMAVESVVRNEVVGNWWVESLGVEVDRLRVEIEEKLIQELVDEVVGGLSGTA